MKKVTRIIQTLGFKGGVTKSTFSNNLASAKALESKVLLVGTDAQNDVEISFDVEQSVNRKGLYDLLVNDAKFDDCIFKQSENLDLLMSDVRMEDYDEDILNKSKVNLNLLSEKLKDVYQRYDYVIFDTAPSSSILTKQLLSLNLGVPTELVLMFEPELYSSRNLLRLINKIEKYQDINKSLKIQGIVATKVQPRVTTHRETLEEVEQALSGYGLKVADTKINYSTKNEKFLKTYGTVIANYTVSEVPQEYKPLLETYLKLFDELGL